MEVDVVAYAPLEGEIRHYELSLDSHTWDKRLHRFEKKFRLARQYMFSELFPFLPPHTPINHFAVLPANRLDGLAGAEVISVDDFTSRVAHDAVQEGLAARAAISEQYPLLRHTQFLLCGYRKRPVINPQDTGSAVGPTVSVPIDPVPLQ
ncbi:hypothetical protein [Burkholderia sp. LMG 13014]|uniref:hypothetical protein n=1 Tax=Burkholderia sp. LMG 13014 TaxID=2709306 RepID=UPI001964ABCA|nr:hypothetical protein [Burkholderia sp. LMG 13014]